MNHILTITSERLRKILETLKSKKICVFGDFYLDRYSIGIMECISREAPIPIVRLKTPQSTRHLPGAAGNVSMNIANLGTGVSVIGIIGDDIFGKHLEEILSAQGVDTGGLVVAKDRPTGAFEKFYASAFHSRIQQVARVDTEAAKQITSGQENLLIDHFHRQLEVCDGFIFADYAEIAGTGVITEKVLYEAAAASRKTGKIFIGDSRLRVDEFKEMMCVPNDYEAAMATGIYESHSSHAIDDNTVIQAGKLLRKKTNKAVFITRGNRGISVFDEDDNYLFKPTLSLDGEIDPTGAGDTVASAIAASLCAGASLGEAAEIANIAARVTVGKIGTTGTASQSEILACHDILRSV